MSKKRAHKGKNNLVIKSSRKKNRTKKYTKYRKNNPKQIKHNCQIEEVQKIEKQNIDTPIKQEQNQSLQPTLSNKIISYYSKSVLNDFETYSSSLFERLLKKELDKDNLAQINERILSNFCLTKEMRKFAFKYLWGILEQYKIPIKFYFKSVLVFDSFLINYSKINNDDKKICSALFKSKHNNDFSMTKLILYTLCCFYIINQIYNTRNFELKCLVNWNNKEEMTYEELNDLVYDIVEVTNCEFDILGIYDFINIFIFDLNKRVKIISNENEFIKCYNKNINYLAMKIVQDISLCDINPSIQAFAVIMFSIEYSKFLTQKLYKNEKINFLVDNWIKNLRNILISNSDEDIRRVIHWLNNYINKY
jgi:hypothetical protein